MRDEMRGMEEEMRGPEGGGVRTWVGGGGVFVVLRAGGGD